MGEEPKGKYKCSACGYLTQRDTPPKSCPKFRTGCAAFDDIGVDRSSKIKAIHNPELI